LGRKINLDASITVVRKILGRYVLIDWRLPGVCLNSFRPCVPVVVAIVSSGIHGDRKLASIQRLASVGGSVAGWRGGYANGIRFGLFRVRGCLGENQLETGDLISHLCATNTLHTILFALMRYIVNGLHQLRDNRIMNMDDRDRLEMFFLCFSVVLRG
jgi:hypothetical protein